MSDKAPRISRLRASCDGCFLAKVKCSKTKPICQRCLTTGTACIYSPSSRAGKTKGDGQSHPRPQTVNPEPINLFPNVPDNTTLSNYHVPPLDQRLHQEHAYRLYAEFPPDMVFNESPINFLDQCGQPFIPHAALLSREGEHKTPGGLKLDQGWGFSRLNRGLIRQPQPASMPLSHIPTLAQQQRWASSIDGSGMTSELEDLYSGQITEISGLLTTNDGHDPYNMGLAIPANNAWPHNTNGGGGGTGNPHATGLRNSNGHGHGPGNTTENGVGNGSGGGNQMMMQAVQPFQGSQLVAQDSPAQYPPVTTSNATSFTRHLSPKSTGSSLASSPKTNAKCNCYTDCLRALAELDGLPPFDPHTAVTEKLLATAHSALQVCQRVLYCQRCIRKAPGVSSLMVLVTLISRVAGSILEFSQALVGVGPDFCAAPLFTITYGELDTAVEGIQELRVVYITFVNLFSPGGELNGLYDHGEILLTCLQAVMHPVIESTTRLKQSLDAWFTF